MKLICFDIDGTLLWTSGAGRRAIHQALLDTIGTTGPIDTLRFDGRTDGEIVMRLAEAAGLEAKAELVERVLVRYQELLAVELARPGHETRVYPGVFERLDELEARSDCLVGLLTGNIEGGAHLKLRSARIAPERFRVGAFGSDSHLRTELPAVARERARRLTGAGYEGHDVIIIGDTPADMQCGQGIGARAVGVATASYSVEQLTDAGAHVALPDLSDRERVVEALFG